MKLAVCVKSLLVATNQSLVKTNRAGYIGLTRTAC